MSQSCLWGRTVGGKVRGPQSGPLARWAGAQGQLGEPPTSLYPDALLSVSGAGLCRGQRRVSGGQGWGWRPLCTEWGPARWQPWAAWRPSFPRCSGGTSSLGLLHLQREPQGQEGGGVPEDRVQAPRSGSPPPS